LKKRRKREWDNRRSSRLVSHLMIYQSLSEQVTHPTYKDELMLMASYGNDAGMWKEELPKVLQAECEE
jgi:hypothetical protein